MGICSSNNKNLNNNIKNKNLVGIKEEGLEGGTEGITELKRLIRYMKKADAICKIEKSEDNFGTGFFCEININEKKIKGLFTCNHVLNKNDLQIGSKINISIINDIEKKIYVKKIIEITKDRFTCTNEELDYTFIKFFDDEPYNNFFEIDNKINCNNPFEEYKLEDLGILQYPKGELYLSEGNLEKVENGILYYSNKTDKGSSGSPIILYLRNLSVIGIHFSGSDDLNPKKGKFFKNILNDVKIKIKDVNLDDIKIQIKDFHKDNHIIAFYNINEHHKYCDNDDKYNLLNYYGNNSWEKNKELNNKIDFEESIDLYLENKKIEFPFKYNFEENKVYNVKIIINKTINNLSKMFSECCSLTSLNLSNFNTNNVTNMNEMFNLCRSLTYLNLSNFNTNNVKDMGFMFCGCSCLSSLDLSNFNTNNVKDMRCMFDNCSSLTSLNLSHFNTNNVTNMHCMFSYCSSLTSLNVSNFNTNNVKDMSYMFNYCSSLTSLNISNFNTNNVTYMNYMFSDCLSLTSLDLSNFNTNNVINMEYIFSECSSLTSLNLSNFKINTVNNKNNMLIGLNKNCNIICNDKNIKKIQF